MSITATPIPTTINNPAENNVIKISKNKNLRTKKWNIDLENNQSIKQDYIVICSALNTGKPNSFAT